MSGLPAKYAGLQGVYVKTGTHDGNPYYVISCLNSARFGISWGALGGGR